MPKDNTKQVLKLWNDFNVKIIIEGMAVGAISGFIIVLYRFLLEHALTFSKQIYLNEQKKTWLIPVWIVILLCAGLLTGYAVKNVPMASGSGIPQVKGILMRKLRMNWIYVLLVKFFGGILSIGAGRFP